MIFPGQREKKDKNKFKLDKTLIIYAGHYNNVSILNNIMNYNKTRIVV